MLDCCYCCVASPHCHILFSIKHDSEVFGVCGGCYRDNEYFFTLVKRMQDDVRRRKVCVDLQASTEWNNTFLFT